MTDVYSEDDFESGSMVGYTIGRASYSYEGRRVTVADLVETGLLEPGTTLKFERVRIGTSHTAVVTPDGRLELPGGRLFRSPSRAAAAAVGGGTFDGWHAWCLPGGTVLDTLRQRLLDTAADSAAPSEGDSSGSVPLRRHERLKQAREAAEAGHPMSLTVRELLGWWDAQRRGYLISQQIVAELANHSLTTAPDFDAVHIDTSVQLVTIEQEDEILEETLSTNSISEPAEPISDDDDIEPVTSLVVGNLRSAFSTVVSVTSASSFEEAITKMSMDDYSQLPVMDGVRTVKGAVTWKSIAKARHADPAAPFSDAIIPADEVPYDRHLIDVLPLLAKSGFVIVRDPTNKVSGIVTAIDVAIEYGAMATPFFLVGEFDRLLRSIIVKNFTLDHVKSLCEEGQAARIGSFDDLSIGHYQSVFRNADAWSKLGWPLDRKAFVERIDAIRKIRNDLMHFNPDPLQEDAVQRIRHMNSLLREYGG
ncbi:CBS domain-containing protein [Streptacidiphilus sp. MAP5-3]|uniref:restriction system modified-DNA reader domain-containing protein n=1 Tax=unclassified Streptacidiphilus TaxID=2643834 RepID=UPI00351299A4